MATHAFSHDHLEKQGIAFQEQIHDHDLAHVSTVEADHLGELTPEELEIEKKLRRNIDFTILPLVILVYIMNYIDRYGD